MGRPSRPPAPTPLYNWFAVLRSDAGGRTTGFIPDGELCSGGRGGPYDFTAYNAVRTDWPLTHLTSGATYQIRHSNWAAHPGRFRVSITPQGWNPNSALRWQDLTQIQEVTDPPVTGAPGALNYYFWNLQMPSGRSGRAILYIQWIRSDSAENFFSCSDIVFDGGNGQVTGVGPNQSQPPPTSVSQPPPPPRPPRPAGQHDHRRRHDHQPRRRRLHGALPDVNEWNAGFQGEITVSRRHAAVSGWTVRWTNPAGTQITQVWNGTYSASGSAASVTKCRLQRHRYRPTAARVRVPRQPVPRSARDMTVSCSSP